uniref:MYC binding protein n=1 Tax=Labrus bergylta TaxID=56723 RepID=A0A3Q3ETU5_9LABR
MLYQQVSLNSCVVKRNPLFPSFISVLVALYETQERPNNALEFVKQHLGAAGMNSEDTEALQQEVLELRQRCTSLSEENKDLKTKRDQQPIMTAFDRFWKNPKKGPEPFPVQFYSSDVLTAYTVLC